VRCKRLKISVTTPTASGKAGEEGLSLRNTMTIGLKLPTLRSRLVQSPPMLVQPIRGRSLTRCKNFKRSKLSGGEVSGFRHLG
jgi:hypothetical protein